MISQMNSQDLPDQSNIAEQFFTISHKQQDQVISALGTEIDKRIKLCKKYQRRNNNFEFRVAVDKNGAKANIYKQVAKMKLYQGEIAQLQLKLTKIFRHSLFQNLTQLNISQCHLTNCQFISHLSSPALQRLYLHSNHLSSLKPFQKLLLPSLLILNIQDNHIHQCHLHRARFNNEGESLVLEFIPDSLRMFEDLGVLVKMQVNSYHRLRIAAGNRIRKKKVLEAMNRKFAFRNQGMSLFFHSFPASAIVK